MAAGGGTTSFPTQAGEDLFDGAASGLVSIVAGLFAGADIRQLDKALSKLYEESNWLAVRVVEFIIAVLWWAAHLGTATSELAGYIDEAQASLNRAASDQEQAWKEFLDVKYPADLVELYDLLHGKIQKLPKVNLAPILAAIKKLEDDDRKERTWQTHTATPKLNQWTKFYAAWRTTYAPPVLTLIDWLKHPAHLASFALPSIIAGMPSQMRRKQSAASVASIETALLATWADSPDQVLGLILNWLVSG